MQFKKEKEEKFKWGVTYLFMPLENYIYIYYVVMQAIFLTLIYLIVDAYERELYVYMLRIFHITSILKNKII